MIHTHTQMEQRLAAAQELAQHTDTQGEHTTIDQVRMVLCYMVLCHLGMCTCVCVGGGDNPPYTHIYTCAHPFPCPHTHTCMHTSVHTPHVYTCTHVPIPPHPQPTHPHAHPPPIPPTQSAIDKRIAAAVAVQAAKVASLEKANHELRWQVAMLARPEGLEEGRGPGIRSALSAAGRV